MSFLVEWLKKARPTALQIGLMREGFEVNLSGGA